MASKYDGLIDEVAARPQPTSPAVAKYGDLIDEVTSSAPLHDSLYGAAGTNPDAEARKLELSKELDTPVGILPADAEQQAQLKKLDADVIKQTTPATAKFLTKEENAKLTGLAGVDKLGNIERAYKTYSPANVKKFIENYTATGKSAAEASQRLSDMKARGVNLADELDPYAREKADIVKDPLKAVAQGTNIMGAGLMEAARQAELVPKLVDLIFPTYGRVRRETNASVQQQLNEGADYWQGEKSPALQKLTDEFNKAGIADSVMMLMAHPELTADQLSISVPYMLPTAGVAKGGSIAVSGYNAFVEASDAANSARQEAIAAGRTPEEQDKAAFFAAVTTAPLVFIGNKIIGTGKLEADFFTKGSIGDNLLKAVVKEAISGSVEEGSNQFGVNVGANTYDENRDLLQGVGKAAVIGGVLESTHAVGMSAAERALRTFVKDIEQTSTNDAEAQTMAAQATAAHDTLEGLGTQVAENDLRKRSPEAFKEFVETMVDDQELQDVYVDGKTMLEAIQQDYVAVQQQAPDLVNRIEQAASLGHDVQIPVSDYLTHIAGTPLEANVLRALKAEPNGATYKDAQEFYKNQADLFQSEVQAVAEQNEPVLSREEFGTLKSEEATQAPIEQTQETKDGNVQAQAQPLPATYEEYVAQHKNQREVFARDVEAVETTVFNEFQKAGRFTSSVNRAYTTPLVEFYKTQAKAFGVLPSEMYAKYPLKIQSFMGWIPGENEVSQATLDDFRPGNVKSVLDKGDWVIMSPENPKAEYTPDRNPELVKKFEEQLKADGIEYYPVDGKYGNEEKSFILFNTTPEQGLALGRQYDQDSVLVKDGLIYQDGTRNPTTGEVEEHSKAPEDFYTTVTFPDGTQSRFTFGIDFDTKLQEGEVKPLTPEMVGSLPETTLVNQGEAKVGQVSVRGVHFSKEQRTSLSGVFYGTGIKGAEGDRLRQAKDGRIKQRLYFYVDEGKGVFPEYGVGNFKHVVDLPNMYDGARNPLKLPTRDKDGNRDMNVFESAVIDAGFDGYYIESAFGRQGAAVMLGNATRNVTPMSEAVVNQSTYYSQLTRTVAGLKQNKGSAEQWKGIIKNLPGVKADEVEAVGVNEWLDLQTGSVTKEDLLGYLDANGVQVEEVVLGRPEPGMFDLPDGWYTEQTESGSWFVRDDLDTIRSEGVTEEAAIIESGTFSNESASRYGDTQYGSYVVGGEGAGTNYREILLTLPTQVERPSVDATAKTMFNKRFNDLDPSSQRAVREKVKQLDDETLYKSSHFQQQNILAHVRVDERVGTNGERVLFVNEVQSDWAQEGKKKGFKETYKLSEIEPLPETSNEADDPDRFWYFKVPGNTLQILKKNYPTQEEAIAYVQTKEKRTDAVPRGPFVGKTDAWVSLALKRILRYAADQGFDKVAIINGHQAADLYKLSTQVESIEWANQVTTDDAIVTLNPINREYIKFKVDRKTGEVTSNLNNADSFVYKKLDDVVGKPMAEKILAEKYGNLKGDGLNIGGEGMRIFYDQIVPKVARDVLKKLGAQPELVSVVDEEPDADKYRIVLPSGKVVHTTNYKASAEANLQFFEGARIEEYTPDIMVQNGFTISPDLKAKIQSGLPLFQGTRGSFNLDTLTMTLLQGSDLSTVIHESGHFYLEMLEKLANTTGAPQQVQDDFAKTMEWFGVTPAQWAQMTLEQKRPMHEQWAESFERWNMEGQAPSQGLQPIFSRFRAWLLSVYKSVEEFVRLNPGAGKLNDEVRAVFSRLLASAEAIEATERAREYQPLYANANDAGVSQEAFQQYLDLGREASRDAVDSLQARSMRDMKWLTNTRNKALKELQATAKATRAKVEAEVSDEVNKEPVYQAIRFLRTGETVDPNTGDIVKAMKGFKLDTAIVKAMYPDTALDNPDLTKLRGMTSPEGLSPDLVAQMFGLTSGDALIREIASAENRRDKIEGLTDQRMLEEHGDLIDERSIQRAADEEVHNEARARFMATGLKMLSKSPISVTQMNKAAKQAAENVITNKRVRDIKPKQFLAAETRANKNVLKLLATKPEEAIDQQRVALLNNRLATAAQDAVTEVEKALRYLDKFNNEGTRKNLDIEYLEQIDALLEPFDLRRGLSLRTIDARTTLTEWVAQQEAMGFEPTIDPAAVAEARQKSYKNMPMGEMRALVDTIKQIEHMGRMKKKLLTALERADFLERIAEAKASIAINANRVVTEKGTPSDALGFLGQWVRQMFAAHRKFASFMRELDGGQNNGALWNLLIRPMATAGNTETEMKASAAEALGRLFDPIQKSITSLGNIYARRRVVPGTNISMTHEQRIMFAMNWGNDGNRQRLLDGGITGKKAMSEQEAQAVLDTLSKAEWDFVQGVWDFIATYKPLIEAQERQLTGKTPEWIEPSEVVTKYGTYPGGYFPAKYDSVLSTRSEALEAASDLRSAMKGAFGSSAARNGYTKERAAQVVGRPLLLNFNAISRHVNEVVHRLAWQAWLIDANRIVRALDSDFRTSLGAEATKEIGDAIRDIAQGDAPAASPAEVALNRVRTGTSIVGMGWSISTALLQPLGLTNSYARVGGVYMSRGLARYLSAPLQTSDWVNEHSALMRNRSRTMTREMNEILNTVRGGDKVSAVTGSFFYLIGKLQRTVDVPTYIGAYERALEELNYELATSSEERTAIANKAHDIAGQTVVDVQGGGELKDLAKIQRGSPIYKLFTNFYSYMATVYNLNVEAVRTTNFKSPAEVAAFTAEMILINFVPVVMTTALQNVLKGKCDWEDTECLVQRYTSQQVSHLFGQMVVLRELGAAADVATGGDGFGYMGPSGVRFFSDVYNAAVQVNQGEMDMAAFKAINNALGALFHYPAGQINKTLDGAIAIENGEVEGAAILPALIAGAPK